LICHPEPAFFAQPEPALSAVEGDLGEPRELSRAARQNNRALGSLPYQTAPLPILSNANFSVRLDYNHWLDPIYAKDRR